MGKKYPLHKDFANFNRFDADRLNLTPAMIKIINAGARFSSALFQAKGAIRRTGQKIAVGENAKIRITLYTPADLDSSAPCLLYFHGGAFVLGDFGYMHERACRYAVSVPCKVVFVHYRLALRHPFPAGVEDCYQSLLWTRDHAAELGIDPDRIAVAGDSAGGALAAAVTLMAKDRNGPSICFQLLVYPVTDMSLTTKSMNEYDDTPGWNSRLSRQMWVHYLRNGDNGMQGYASPMHAADLSGLPPAYMETQEFDCLRDEGKAYAEKLAAHGVPVELNEILGTFHGFDLVLKSSLVQEALRRRIVALQRAFGLSS